MLRKFAGTAVATFIAVYGAAAADVAVVVNSGAFCFCYQVLLATKSIASSNAIAKHLSAIPTINLLNFI